MKKLFITIGLVCFVGLTSKGQAAIDQVLAGTLTTPGGALSGTTNVFQITTNRATVHRIQLSSSATGIIQMYDSDNTNAPFFGMFTTNDTYWTRSSYPTNYVTTYISGLTGTTNVMTNSGVWTYFVTNAPNTNQMNASYAAPFTANIAFLDQNLNMTFARGITIRTTTNVNYSIWYTP